MREAESLMISNSNKSVFIKFFACSTHTSVNIAEKTVFHKRNQNILIHELQ